MKFLNFIIISFLFTNIIFANEIKFTQEEKEYLKNKKEITMCIDPSWMPFESFDSQGRHVGISADYYKIFRKVLKIDIRVIKTKTWIDSINKAKNRECDILSLVMETNERKKYLNFTTAYLKMPLVITTKKDVPFIDNIRSIGNKKVGIPKGYAFIGIFKSKYPNLNIIEVTNIEEGLSLVNQGKIFAYIGTFASVHYVFHNGQSGELKISGKFDETWELGIGVRNDDKILLNILQKAVDAIEEKQEQKILNDWISPKYERGIDYTLVWQIIGISILLGLLSLFWMRKITKANQVTKESLANFEHLFNNTIETIGIFQNGCCININEAGMKLFGFSNKEEVIGKTAMSFIAPDSIEMAKKNHEAGSEEPYEPNAIKVDGTIFPSQLQGKNIMLSGIETRIVSVLDLTNIKENEKQLIEAKLKAQESTKLKSDFLANMSHEIRTPMNGIIGMTHLALKTRLDPKQTKYLSSIDSSAKSLLNIINDILDLSKIEAGKMEINKIDFNLEQILDSVFSIMKFKAEEKGLDFVVKYEKGINTNLFGDSLRISQILINLLNNAIKFTEKGHVHIHISAKDNLYTFSVEDSGIGIDDMQQSKLFQSFSQADGSTTRKYGGTGLGLSISKQLVELMNGKIWVESQLGKGSFFIFELELEEAKNEIVVCEKKKIGIEDIQVLTGSNILLVEDNITNQEIVVGLLEGSGINIDIASNGAKALDMYRSNPDKYEFILMDLQMPIMNGFEATKIIRDTESGKNIPIIALTANAMEEDIEKTKSVGMNEQLTKPIEIDKLYETLLKYISKKVNHKAMEVKTSEDISIPSFINIDTKIGLSHMGEDKKLYLKILNAFYTNNKGLKLENLDEKELERTAHTINGLSASIGAGRLSDISKRIEKSLDKQLFSEFYEEFNKVLDELKSLEQNEPQQILLDLDDTKRDELFNSLKEYAKKRRARQCNDIISELNTYTLSNVDGKRIGQIEELLSRRDYKKILEIL